MQTDCNQLEQKVQFMLPNIWLTYMKIKKLVDQNELAI